MSRIKKICPTCDEFKDMTRHHIFPKRHHQGRNNNYIYILCRECHDYLETLIPYKKMPREFYPAILKIFIEELCKKARKQHEMHHLWSP